MSPDAVKRDVPIDNNNKPLVAKAVAETEQSCDAELTTKKFGLHRDEVIPQFRMPFIISGYRKPNLKAVECMQSAFIPTCNEAVNFWSHFIAFAMFSVKFYDLYTTKYSVYDVTTWPTLSAAVGICGFCLASSVAHLFNSMSLKALRCCFFMDYAAISVYTVALGQACFMYNRPLESPIYIFQTEWPFTVLSVLASINATCLCCMSTFRWQQHKFLIRTAAFIVTYIINSGPLTCRIIVSSNGPDRFHPLAASAFSIHFTLYVLSALVNALRLPERILPGFFDVFGHSHHLLHIFTAVGACYQFDAFHLDMANRKDVLMSQTIKGSPYNTILPLAISIFANFGLAVFFGKRIGKQGHHKAE